MQLFVLGWITTNPDGSPLLFSEQTIRTYNTKKHQDRYPMVNLQGRHVGDLNSL